MSEKNSILRMQRFAEVCDAVAATTKKTEKVRLVGEYLKTTNVEDAAVAAVFLTGRAFPLHDERVLGVGGSLMFQLVADFAQRSPEELAEAYRRRGDLGQMAEDVLAERRSGDGVAVANLHGEFLKIAESRGQTAKIDLLRRVFERATPGEVKYVIKIVTGELRIGLKESLVEEAIAKAYDAPLDAVRRANMLMGDIGATLRLAAANDLASARMQAFRPIGFMLATPVETAEELAEAADGPVYVEEKYDGIRGQIHKSGGKVRIFSRTLDEVTEFPEVNAQMAEVPGDWISDGEILAWSGGKPLPFTDLQKRLGRKQNQMGLWEEHAVAVKYVAFDLLAQDGELLIDMPLAERRARLERAFGKRAGRGFSVAPVKMCESAQEIREAFESALRNAHEGIVAKSPNSLYTPGRRGQSWFKLKEPYATLDVVVTAVEFGHGKRHGLLSDYTFAVRKGELLVNIGKAYSGLTDVEIKERTEYFLQRVTRDEGFRKIVAPELVIEVAFNNIQQSERHESGYALRFPRIVRLRPDKPVAEIDTVERVAELYGKQTALPMPVERRGGSEE